MKVILRSYGIGMDYQERIRARGEARDLILSRGTSKTPSPPRDIFVQSAPRGILVNWRLPAASPDVAGFRIYKDTETNLFAEIKDPYTTQHVVDCTAGASPPVTNIFVSCVNKLGFESPKVQMQGSATIEAAAPTFPVSPPAFGVASSPTAGGTSGSGGSGGKKLQ